MAETAWFGGDEPEAGYNAHMQGSRLKELFDPAPWMRRLDDARERWFDLRHGLDTISRVDVTAMPDIPRDAARHAVQYEPTPIRKFRRAIALLDIDPRCYSFVDFGSGKGRVLLLAAGYPFRRIVGVELSASLHDIARRNVAAFRRRHADAPPIDCVCADARDFPLPDGNLLAFFYNPFDAEVLGPTVERFTRATSGDGRSLAIVYINPLHHEVIDTYAQLRCLGRDAALAVYRTP